MDAHHSVKSLQRYSDNSNSCKSDKIKRSLQYLLVPVSLLSLLLSYTSGFSFNFNFSTSVFSILAHALERKYMFLICNGILAVLAKSLNFSSSSSPSPDSSDSIVEAPKASIGTDDCSSVRPGLLVSADYPTPQEEEPEKREDFAEDNDPSMLETAAASEGDREIQESGQMEESGVLITESEESEGEEDDEDFSDEGGALIGSSPAEEAIEVNVNTEELNKKFEEFIRKMKEEIRIEAQQQLIAV